MKINKSLLFATLLAAFSQTMPSTTGTTSNGRIFFLSGQTSGRAVPVAVQAPMEPSFTQVPVEESSGYSVPSMPAPVSFSSAAPVTTEAMHETIQASQAVTTAATNQVVQEAVQSVAGIAAQAKSKTAQIQAQADELKNQANHHKTHKALDELNKRLDKKDLAEKEMKARMLQKHQAVKAQLDRIESATRKS